MLQFYANDLPTCQNVPVVVVFVVVVVAVVVVVGGGGGFSM